MRACPRETGRYEKVFRIGLKVLMLLLGEAGHAALFSSLRMGSGSQPASNAPGKSEPLHAVSSSGTMSTATEARVLSMSANLKVVC